MPNEKKVVYIDMDDTICDFKNAFIESKEKRPDIDWPQSQFGFFMGLKPLPGAVEVIKDLIQSDDYDTYILTAPSVRNPSCYMEKRVWIEKYFGLDFCKKLIISPNKGLNIGSYLIDDNVSGKGQENFVGEVIQYGGENFPDWLSIKNYLNV